MTQTTQTGVEKVLSRGKIIVDNVHVNDFQKKGTATAQIRQDVITEAYYPSKKTASNLQESLFTTEEFGFEKQKFESKETRVAWLLVPETSTKEQVQAKIDALPDAVIYRILSNQPILDENQQYAVDNNIRTFDQFADKQVVRTPKNEETVANGTAGTLLLDKPGNVQYRRTFFWKTPMADIDTRGTGKVYLTAEIKAEMAGASTMQGQTV